MFGNNPIRKAAFGIMHALHVESIFYTIQGEGPMAGMPAVFVRLAGCNLACHWCDTQFEEGMLREPVLVTRIAELVAAAHVDSRVAVQSPLVVITGGEPLRQDITELCRILIHRGYTVQIETNGTLMPPTFFDLLEHLADTQQDQHLVLVCSPKTPKLDKWLLQHCKHFKYIVGADDNTPSIDMRRDGLPVTSPLVKDTYHRVFRPWWSDNPDLVDATIWVSPRDDHDPERNKLNTMHAVRVCMNYGYRLSIQMHKVIGVE